MLCCHKISTRRTGSKLWNRRSNQGPQRPPIKRITDFWPHCPIIVCSLLNPLAENFYLPIRKLLLGHFQVRVLMLDRPYQKASIRIVWYNGFATRPTLLPAAPPIKCQSTFHLPRLMRMTTVATTFEDRQHRLAEVFRFVCTLCLLCRRDRADNAKQAGNDCSNRCWINDLRFHLMLEKHDSEQPHRELV